MSTAPYDNRVRGDHQSSNINFNFGDINVIACSIYEVIQSFCLYTMIMYALIKLNS